ERRFQRGSADVALPARGVFSFPPMFGQHVELTEDDRHFPVAGKCLSSSDRKSTRLNSSHEWISYAVFCLEKKMNSGPASQIAPGQVQSPLPSIESRWISCDRYGCGLGYIGQVRR